jgi:hypothetical protein
VSANNCFECAAVAANNIGEELLVGSLPETRRLRCGADEAFDGD